MVHYFLVCSLTIVVLKIYLGMRCVGDTRKEYGTYSESREEKMSDKERMPLSKLEAFYREFPWLEKVIDKEYVNTIKVERIDLELYRRQRRSHTNNDYWGEAHIVYDETLVVITKDGLISGTVGRKEEPMTVPIQKGFWRRFFEDEINLDIYYDTLEGLFLRLGSLRTPMIGFVVSVCGRDVVIYKAPKDMTVQAYIEQEIQYAQNEVKKEVEAV